MEPQQGTKSTNLAKLSYFYVRIITNQIMYFEFRYKFILKFKPAINFIINLILSQKLHILNYISAKVCLT